MKKYFGLIACLLLSLFVFTGCEKVENGNYSSWEIMEEFTKFHKYLTKEEVEQIKNRLKNSIRR